MSIARTTLLERITTFRAALEIEALIAKSLTDLEHNNKARLLRNGATVVGFAILEDFIRARTSELLSKISNGVVKFDELPDRLRRAATYDAVYALSFQADLLKKSGQDYTALVQEHCRMIASTSSTNFEITSVSFAHNRSNISSEDIKEILGAMGVKDAWGVIEKIAKRAGLGAAISLQSAFVEASKRRHRAAHRANHESASQDLINFHKEALGIALGFDIVLSRTVRLIADKKSNQVEKLTDTDFILHFVDQNVDGIWRWHPEVRPTVFKKARDEKVLLPLALARARKLNAFVIIRGTDAIPRSWVVPEVT